jgi:uncharacterized protein Smg (DUF494 family)
VKTNINKILDIVMTCIQSLKEDTSQDGFHKLKSSLKSDGYTEQEIDFGFSFYFLTKPSSTFDNELPEKRISSHGFRILNDFEKRVISPEVEALLMQLCHSNFITEEQHEEIIEQITFTDQEEINEETIKLIIASTIWGHALSQLLPGEMESWPDGNFVISIH